MEYTVLSPWAESESAMPKPLSPRLDTLDGKTIGLFAHFKQHSPYIMREVERQLSALYPNTKFTHYQYIRDTRELVNDDRHKEEFLAWLDTVDGVIGCYGDAGSCSMFLCYNMAYIEKLGKPTVTLCHTLYYSSGVRGAASRAVPDLRIVQTLMEDLTWIPAITDEVIENTIRPAVAGALDELVAGLTAPLTDKEKNPQPKEDFSKKTYTGDLEEINRIFYVNGWTNGQPIIPPTEEAVNRMLAGTDLPRDHVVAVLPPMLGKATVEKIAVAAVMAGCLPTYLPVVIAAVKGMSSPLIQLEGWTCSNASWAPVEIVSGSMAKQIGLNSDRNVLSPFFKPNAAIARAVAYVVMNVCGVRPKLEDMSVFGHMGRLGSCFAENEDESPWKPLRTMYGFAEDENALIQFWPFDHQTLKGETVEAALTSFCNVTATGWANGLMLMISPEMANMFAKEGWDQTAILDYILEYNRVPGSRTNLRWLIGNNHVPEGVPLPRSGDHWTRLFWSKEHMFIVVAGRTWATGMSGGGDHGGPVTTKIELPKNWNSLVEQYSPAYTQHHVEY
jgi:hypothetical protein